MKGGSRWILREPRRDVARRLAAATGLPPTLCAVLAARGWLEPERVREHLAPDLGALPPPDLLPDVDLAADRIAHAIARGERITVYGDYDVDGTASIALLVDFCGAAGASIDYYVPDRVAEGYGLSVTGVERLAARGTKLIVTVDCGTTSFEEIDRANSLGMEVVVIDHHQTPRERPAALALLNPHRPDSTFPDTNLCSAGLSFYLAAAVRRKLRAQGRFLGRREPNLKSLLDLVALATVADVVPLVGVNRILVHHGLASLQSPRRAGLLALKEVSGLGPGPVSCGHVGFRLAPRLNAAGRLGDARRAVELMLSADAGRARSLALELDEENRRRQEIEQGVVDEAVALALAAPDHARAAATVVASQGWHPGVIGIVAARLVERFGRPAVVIALDGEEGKGSARTAGKVHLFQMLKACRSTLTQFGGHAAAAGLSIRAAEVGAFRESFNAAVGGIADAERRAVHWLDGELDASEVTGDLAEALERLRPFGPGNSEPVFLLRNLSVDEALVAGARHLRLRVSGLDAIGFGMGDQLPGLGTRVDLRASVRIDDFTGRRLPKLHLKAQPEVAASAEPHDR